LADALRITVAAILLLMAIGILSQVGNFLALILKMPVIAKWTNILVVLFTALVVSWWIYEVG
jgi:hypothetical protein